MIKFIVNKVIKDSENVENKEVRENYGVLAGALGIICNALLVAIKLTIGFIMNSIAIISDGFNNLSDMGTSLVSLIGAKLSAKRPDSDHPFGHGRFEYISALIVSFIIIFVGVETGISSVKKIITPEKVNFSWIPAIILLVSCGIKLWMFSYNKYLGKKIDSTLLDAASKDSLNDVFATLAVIIATVLGYFLPNFPIDGILGTVVSILILKAGYEVASDTITRLLGRPPQPETVKQIHDIVMSGEGIVGVHDLYVHDYGPGRTIASVHAEVPDDANITRVHEIIDGLERQIGDEMGIIMVIHMDPIAVNCPKTNELREMVLRVITEVDENVSMHDFRITDGEDNINMIFDIVVPIDYKEQKREAILAEIKTKIKAENNKCSTVISVDEM